VRGWQIHMPFALKAACNIGRLADFTRVHHRAR
jgi:hypothetical protein